MSDTIFSILPLIIISILVMFLIIALKKKHEKRKISVHRKTDENKVDTDNDYMSIGMSLGMCFGVAIGSSLKNILGSNAMSYGICFGMLGGMLIGMTIKKK